MSSFWQPQGLLFGPLSNLYWCRTHAMLPTPFLLNPTEHIWRIYFSGRDDSNRSAISFFDLKASDTQLSIIYIHEEPALTPGRLGTFDDNGVSPSCVIVNDNDQKLLYYIGWNPGSTTRVNLYGGLAQEVGGNEFQRVFESPLLERIPSDPLINTAPWVVKVDQHFVMFYVSGLRWNAPDFPYYNIKYAYSDDGINWRREGKVALDFSSSSETALARPFVIKDQEIWRMWFSKRIGNYSIGYAESIDGITWNRRDSIYGLQPGNRPGEDVMVEYAVVINSENSNWLLYNGNDYGRLGIFHARGSNFDR